MGGGEVATVVDANGSGKSTLLNIRAGTTRASNGSLERTARLGYAPQQGRVAPLLTAHEHFRLVGRGVGWAIATLSLFAHVNGRQLDQRLGVIGA